MELERIEELDTFWVPVHLIYVDPEFNCRNPFTLQSVKSLADNIAARDLDFPVVLQRIEDTNAQVPAGYLWRLIAGFRRFAAVTTFLKWTKIKANIKVGITDQEAEILNLTENLERKDLNPLEEAQALARRFKPGIPLREIAKAMNRDTRWVHQRLRLMELPQELRDKVAAGLLTLLDVDVLVKVPPDEQAQAAQELIAARGKRKRKLNVNPKFRRKFRYRRGKEEINTRIAQLMEAGLSGLTTRFGGWCAGYISDDDFDHDIELAIREKSEEISSPSASVLVEG